MKLHDDRALEDIALERSELKAAEEVRKQRELVLAEREKMIKAFAGGVPCQLRRKGEAEWKDAVIPGWYWDEFEYRIKPKLQECFITVQGDDIRRALEHGTETFDNSCFVGGSYVTEAAAQAHVNDWAFKHAPASRVFKVTEVL